ncbi:NCK-interacting protein with SH3 domain-like isoform X1 [Penaeus japonicus]|uniref:NCK-interacting protein with SH3 domain-like isoform X1 n=1 Tax=Penaeus japonicus TaxID=27405 RepID=UPI001C70B706|nr:NCK-interacting protein with SH3 domain-like isoform X1 [Penaeus japonicus]
MLRSLYAYKGTHARTLGFQVGDKFMEIGPSRDPNWLHVINERGAVGYVPKNYISADEQALAAGQPCPQEGSAEDPEAPPIDILEFIDGCIEAIHLNASERGGNYTRGEHDALLKLVELRQDWYSKCPPSSHPTKRPAPPPPQRTTSQLSVDSVGSLPSPCLPGTPRSPSISASGSSVSLGPPPKEATPTESTVETTTSFMARGESLVRDESSGSSEGHDTSIGYESEMRSDVDSVVQTSIKSLVSQVPKEYLRTLVEEVRSSTSISYTTSHQDKRSKAPARTTQHRTTLSYLSTQRVVEVVLNSLATALPVLQPLCLHILSSKGDQVDGGVDKWQQSSDGRRLVELLEKLRECKDDEQQRSWALHEDEHTITTHLSDLLDLLNTGDLMVCRSVLSLDDFRPLLTLVQYYQMETRWPLRKLLLQVFGAVCQMSAANISYLSASVFPVELTRELLDSTYDQERLRYTSLVLGMVLCMGDTLPYPHFCVMNENFMNVLLDGIEQYHEDPDTEQLAELYLAIVLAFNLQYTTLPPSAANPPKSCETADGDSEDKSQSNGDVEGNKESSKTAMGADSENIIIKLLSKRENTKYFTEKLLLLFNREEDPLAMFDHEPRPPHSVLKMMRDMYSTRATASIFYTNDECVVCDIIIRQLSDLPADDKRRSEYLHLMEGVIVAGRWTEHQHRRKELCSSCANILAEEEPAALDDQKLIKSLMESQQFFFHV